MNNFLNFILEDIEAKKTLIATLPTNTKTNIKKYNEKLTEINLKYDVYKKSIKKYIDAKNKKLYIKPVKKELEKLSSEVAILEHVRFILNPQNTYYEKIGFDNLVYQLSNYSDFQFDSLNKIINGFLNKFELVGIKLKNSDFNYTCYVREYMDAFLKVRNKTKNSYEQVSKIFEKIYWVNPDLISHIELNFRYLIKKYETKFNSYILKLQKDTKEKYNIKNYDACMNKLKEAYSLLNTAEEENINDIITLAQTGEIDINHYLPDNKVRSETYSALSIDSLNISDIGLMENFYTNIRKLKKNIEEYNNYVQFIPLINNFKKEYEKNVNILDKNYLKDLKSSMSQIKLKENKLEKITKKINSNSIFNKVSKDKSKALKLEAVKLANELYSLYKIYDKQYFDSKVFPILNNSFTIADFLTLYYSFDYYKKISIKKVFELNDYNELLTFADNFDLFAMNPTNVIMHGVFLFEDSDVAKVIINKYRLSNINLTEEDLNSDDLETLLNKLKLLIRIDKIEHSTTSVEKIWFMVKTQIINSEKD